MTQKELIIYQTKDGAIELHSDFKKETVWATQKQIAELFGVNVRTVNEHLKNIYKIDELSESSTIRNFRIVQKEGGRNVERDVNCYNLDAIISVGYRVNSVQATNFRKWATKTLKKHLVEGYTINKKRIERNYDSFMEAVSSVKAVLPQSASLDADEALDLIKVFAHTWLSLDAYDKGDFPETGLNKKQVTFTGEELTKAVTKLKKDLISKKQATELFAQEKKEGSLESIVGSVFQSAFGKDAYPTMEEKAAHLLYFIVKNHPFNDGNKRTGAYAFVWFLRKAGLLHATLTPEALTSLTLLITESNPKEKDKMIGLVLLLVNRS